VNSISGVNVAAITPRGKELTGADLGATLELIDFLCAAGVKGIALLGSTGEFLNFSLEERNRLIYLAAKRCRVSFLAGVGHSSLDGALELGREACAAGASGLLLMPPYFFRYDQDDIRHFFLEFARQLGQQADIYLYNIPAFTSGIAVETAAELLSTGLFAGIKDSSGNFEYFEHLRGLRDTTPFTLLVGNDVIFTRARQAGADGVISGVASAVPELLLDLDAAIQAGQTAEIHRLETALQEFISWIDRFPAPVGVKAAAAARGIKTGALLVPLPPARQKALEEFKEWFLHWLPEIRKNAAK
jgi:4-hydroxy-tetrahydrodipicolinate synthase